jgi:hypothetical protein
MSALERGNQVSAPGCVQPDTIVLARVEVVKSASNAMPQHFLKMPVFSG